MENKICALVVTFNRKDYLLKALNALKTQTIFIDTIIIVDNNSTDGTELMLKKEGFITNSVVDDLTINNFEKTKIIYYKSSVNTGGSGGFKRAFEIALNEECDYIWAMDDDVLPQPNCLQALLSEMSDEIGVCIPNRNTGRFEDRAVLEINWKNPLRPVSLKKTISITDQNILVKDFPFEGPLFKKDIVQKIGTPNSDYFLFFDDTDYAQKCLEFTNILYVVSAKLNKQIIPDIESKSKFDWRTYYVIRNEIIFDKIHNKYRLISATRPYILLLLRLIKYTINNNRNARKYVLLAFRDARNGKLGKTIEPGSF